MSAEESFLPAVTVSEENFDGTVFQVRGSSKLQLSSALDQIGCLDSIRSSE